MGKIVGISKSCCLFSLICGENLEKCPQRQTPREETCLCCVMGEIISQNLTEIMSQSKIEDETW